MITLERRYHVPRSQVWEGSGGRQRGKVHLHVGRDSHADSSTGPRVEIVRQGLNGPYVAGLAFQILPRIRRFPGQALCGRPAWYDRAEDPGQTDELCPRCVDIATRAGASIPAAPQDR